MVSIGPSSPLRCAQDYSTTGEKMTLNWESTYAIALELRRQHPEANLDELTLGKIYRWTLELSEFEDDPSLANDDILYAIYQDWFEENIHGQ